MLPIPPDGNSPTQASAGAGFFDDPLDAMVMLFLNRYFPLVVFVNEHGDE